MMEIRLVTDNSELAGIKTLQQQNLRAALTEAEAKTQGFVTAEYTLDFLKEMHEATPSVIATDGGTVAGYALATTKEVGLQHDLIRDLFEAIDRITYGSIMLKDTNYIVIGQLCVAKGYRGTGLAQKLYEHFRKVYSGRFKYGITDVAAENPRSLAAHLKSGFKVIDTLSYGGIKWNIVLWDWN